jgi:hypothetical protein
LCLTPLLLFEGAAVTRTLCTRVRDDAAFGEPMLTYSIAA